VLNFDGTTEDVKINAKGINEFNEPIMDEETGEQVIVNDLSRGKYQSYVEAGPAFTTLRQESAQQLIELATGSPVFERVATDLIAKNLGILESDELTSRVRKLMIQDGTVTPTEEEIEELGLGQPQPPSEEQLALLENVRMQTAQMAADIENKNADSDKKDSETLKNKMTAQGQAITAYGDLIDAYEQQAKLGINLGITEHMLRKAQQGIIDLSQEELVAGNV
jgi:tRNA(Ser,Leu) C12 N-acetylase TAN1